MGGLITIAIGSAVSLLCEEKLECDMDALLFSPFARKYINSRKLLSIRPDVKEKSCVIHAFEIKRKILNFEVNCLLLQLLAFKYLQNGHIILQCFEIYP